VPPESLATMYNAADFTINISDAEGFGLATLESLSCGTPIVVSMTGGLQEQVTDGKNWFGFGIEPSSKSVIGSLQVPYIYEDRIAQKDFNDALTKAIKISDKAYKKMSIQAREHVMNNYNFEAYTKRWVEIMDDLIERHGSWDSRKLYDRWHLMEVA
jgi:glycosyltransferase involved in cell wall biosynthesis